MKLVEKRPFSSVWSTYLGPNVVRIFPAAWNLQQRQERARFQAVCYDIPASLTAENLYKSTGELHPVLKRPGVKAFKIVHDRQKRKLILYLESWDTLSALIGTKLVWDDSSVLHWCRHDSPVKYNHQASFKTQDKLTKKPPKKPLDKHAGPATGANKVEVNRSRGQRSRNTAKDKADK